MPLCHPATVVAVADEPEPLRDMVRRLIRQELEQGGYDRLVEARQVVEASFTLRVTPSLGSMTPAVPPGSPGISVTPRLSFDVGPKPTEQIIRPTGIPSEEAFGEPSVIPAEVVDAVRSASPALADEIQSRSSHDEVMLILTIFGIVVAALQTAMQAYQFFNPQAPTPTQVVQIFNQIYNMVNPPSPVNPPPPPGE